MSSALGCYLFGLIVVGVSIFVLICIFVPELIHPGTYNRVKELTAELGLELRSFKLNSFEIGGVRKGVACRLFTDEKQLQVEVEIPVAPASLKLTQGRGQRFLTGDPEFDHRVLVGGDEVIALALLDNETRELVRRLVVMGGTVDDSRIVVTQENVMLGLEHSIKNGVRALEAAVNLTQRLAIEGPDLPKRLAHNAASDTNFAVRRQNLLALGRHFPQHPVCLRHYRATLADPWPEFRFLAADFLSRLPGTEPAIAAEAREVLTNLVQNTILPEELRARAITSLATREISPKHLRILKESVLDGVLAAGKGGLLVAAIGSVAALERREYLPRLLELVPDALPAVALALAQALGQLGGPEVQPALLELLGHEDPAVWQATVEALGQAGDAGAVESLLALAHHGDKKHPAQAALAALRSIQGRLLDAEAGQLSLVTPQGLEGALSPAEASAGPGDLSLADAAKEPLPPPPPRRTESS